MGSYALPKIVVAGLQLGMCAADYSDDALNWRELKYAHRRAVLHYAHYGVRPHDCDSDTWRRIVPRLKREVELMVQLGDGVYGLARDANKPA